MCEATWKGEATLPDGDEINILLPVAEECGNIKVLEHVHVVADVKSLTRRGAFSVQLESPSGTVSQLLAPRPVDGIAAGTFNKFTIKKVLQKPLNMTYGFSGIMV